MLQCEQIPQLINSCKTPKVIWFQNDLFVVLRIILTDVEKYFLRVERDRLLFGTNLNGTKYFLNLRMFGSLIAEESDHSNKGRELQIYLKKSAKFHEWSRLQYENKKNLLISHDLEHINFEDDWKRKWMNPNTFRDNSQLYSNLQPDGPSSDEGSDDDAFNNIFDEFQ